LIGDGQHQLKEHHNNTMPKLSLPKKVNISEWFTKLLGRLQRRKANSMSLANTRVTIN
jgi:hypothetical protein